MDENENGGNGDLNSLRERMMNAIQEHSAKIAQKFVEIMQEENGAGLGDYPDELKRLIHNYAIYHYLKVVNFPSALWDEDEDNTETLSKYNAFAEDLKTKFSNLCDELYVWEP